MKSKFIFKIFFWGLMTQTIFFIDPAMAAVNENFARITAKSGLNLRNSHNKTSKVVLLLPADARVRILETAKAEESIDGKNGHWAKVRWVNNTGWVFDAFLEKTKAGDAVADFTLFLEKNNIKDEFQAIDAALKEYRAILHKNKNAAYVLYRTLKQFIQPKQNILSEKYSGRLPKYGSTNDYEKDPLIKKLDAYGLQVYMEEGEYFFYINDSFYLNDAAINIPGMKEYSSLRNLYGIWAECGVSVPWEEIRSRIITVENFMNKYPAFPESRELNEVADRLLSPYLAGGECTPLCVNGQIEPFIKDSYEMFLKENKKSKYYLKIKNHYENLKKKEFKCGE